MCNPKINSHHTYLEQINNTYEEDIFNSFIDPPHNQSNENIHITQQNENERNNEFENLRRCNTQKLHLTIIVQGLHVSIQA